MICAVLLAIAYTLSLASLLCMAFPFLRTYKDTSTFGYHGELQAALRLFAGTALTMGGMSFLWFIVTLLSCL